MKNTQWSFFLLFALTLGMGILVFLQVSPIFIAQLKLDDGIREVEIKEIAGRNRIIIKKYESQEIGQKIRPGDRIVNYGRKHIQDDSSWIIAQDQLWPKLLNGEGYEPADSIQVDFIRDNAELNKKIRLEQRTLDSTFLGHLLMLAFLLLMIALLWFPAALILIRRPEDRRSIWTFLFATSLGLFLISQLQLYTVILPSAWLAIHHKIFQVAQVVSLSTPLWIFCFLTEMIPMVHGRKNKIRQVFASINIVVIIFFVLIGSGQLALPLMDKQIMILEHALVLALVFLSMSPLFTQAPKEEMIRSWQLLRIVLAGLLATWIGISYAYIGQFGIEVGVPGLLKWVLLANGFLFLMLAYTVRKLVIQGRFIPLSSLASPQVLSWMARGGSFVGLIICTVFASSIILGSIVMQKKFGENLWVGMLVCLVIILILFPIFRWLKNILERMWLSGGKTYNAWMDDIQDELNKCRSFEDIGKTLEKAMIVIRSNGVALWENSGDNWNLRAKAGKIGNVWGDVQLVLRDSLPLGRNWMGQVIQTTVDDGREWALQGRLFGSGQMILWFTEKQDNESFLHQEKLFLSRLGRACLGAVHTVSLIEKVRKQDQMEHEMNVARKIQQDLIPSKPLHHQDVKVAGINVQARAVGGDYFDYFTRTDGKMVIICADVAGKGVPAALLMSSLRSSVRSLLTIPCDLVGAVKMLNQQIFDISGPASYVCFFVVILDSLTGEGEAVNCGHASPLKLSKGVVESIPEHSIVIGIKEDSEFESYPLKLEKGDSLLLYTDGASELEISFDKELGMEGLGELALIEYQKEPGQWLQRLYNRLSKYSNIDHDDLTLVALHFGQEL